MVNVGCFLFSSSEQKFLEGNIECLGRSSPVTKSEFGQDWITFSTVGFSPDGDTKTKNEDNGECYATQPLPSSSPAAFTQLDEDTDDQSIDNEQLECSDTMALLNNTSGENELKLCDKIRNMFVLLKNVLRRICCCCCC